LLGKVLHGNFAILIHVICRLMRTADIGTKYQRIGNIQVHMVVM
jgi:hypothetical protein